MYFISGNRGRKTRELDINEAPEGKNKTEVFHNTVLLPLLTQLSRFLSLSGLSVSLSSFENLIDNPTSSSLDNIFSSDVTRTVVTRVDPKTSLETTYITFVNSQEGLTMTVGFRKTAVGRQFRENKMIIESLEFSLEQSVSMFEKGTLYVAVRYSSGMDHVQTVSGGKILQIKNKGELAQFLNLNITPLISPVQESRSRR